MKQYGVKRASLPLRRIGDDGLGHKLEAGQILPQSRQASVRAIDRHHMRAGLRKLCGLAAGRRAEISDGLAADSAVDF